MLRRSEWQTSCAVCASIVGAGFASGREIEAFFARLGAASWAGAAAACAGVGLIVFSVMTLARRTGAQSLPALYGRLINRRWQQVMRALYGLLLLATASAMTAAGGEIGALALDARASREIGAGIALCAGIALAVSGVPALGRAGLAAVLATAGAWARRSELPLAALTARWGIAGYNAALLLMALAVITTLGAMLSSLCDLLPLPRAAALGISAALCALVSRFGFGALVDAAYPMLGWACVFALLLLPFHLVQAARDADDDQSSRSRS